ncbi:MAG: hypothetical protein USCAAHI_00060 [Beijerinckiaceae bacterium]|nr:MAG: hypothetical protein USCAAHI_00060 [Beijerinckiaceae bacterium]
MGQTYGVAIRDRYWEIFEKLRSEIGYADYWAPCYQWRRQIVPKGGEKVYQSVERKGL